MTQAAVLDSEDHMAQALAEIREARNSGTDVVHVEAAVGSETDHETPAGSDPTTDVKSAASEEASPAPTTEPTASAAASTLDPVEEQRRRSEAGRVSALTRRVDELRAEKEALLQRLNAPATASVQAKAQVDKADATLEKLAALEEQVKAFPELKSLVSVVREGLEGVRAHAEQVAQQAVAQAVEPLEPVRREFEERSTNERQAADAKAADEFKRTYPNAREVITTSEFRNWLPTNPHVQQLYRTAKGPKEAMVVMDAYDAHLRRAGKQPIAVFEKPAGATAPSAAPAARDQSRLRSAVGIPSRQSGARGAMPPADDFEGSLAHFRKQRMAARTSA